MELLIEYARTHSDARIQRHVERSVRHLANLKTQRLIDVVIIDRVADLIVPLDPGRAGS